ncbi:hypothetical protein ABT127_34685 [Streptomyces sp. NPDC001904]|uniref:hypothetical protein n=1 Tax=Streptomyces sp. NPDC001904 TaxID=3154531 RepID=UPI0033335077
MRAVSLAAAADEASAGLHAVLGPVCALVLLWFVLGALMRAAAAVTHNGELRVLQTARRSVIRPDQLTDEAAALLVRAQRAVERVAGSEVHRRDLVDRLRNDRVLPLQVWEIAQALASYSRLLLSGPAQPTADRDDEAVDCRDGNLALALAGIEARLKALEIYADQAAEADRSLSEFEQMQRLAGDDGDVLDVLADTAAHELAVADLAGMAARARVVADTFSGALELARLAVLSDLPGDTICDARSRR